MKYTFTQISIWIKDNQRMMEDAKLHGRNVAGLKRMRAELEILKYEVLKDYCNKEEISNLMIELS